MITGIAFQVIIRSCDFIYDTRNYLEQKTRQIRQSTERTYQKVYAFSTKVLENTGAFILSKLFKPSLGALTLMGSYHIGIKLKL